MSVIKNKGVETDYDKVLKWMVIILGVLFVVIVIIGTVYDVYIMNEYDELSEGSSYTRHDYDGNSYNGAISLGIRCLEEGGIKK